MTLQEAVIAAKRVERKTGVPAEVIVAQWALESGWGKHAPGNNCFGIKAYAGCHGRQLIDTTEWFTASQLKAFLARDPARTAEEIPGELNSSGKRKYRVKDWFATFPTLEACFEKRAELFSARPYRVALELYLAEGDIERFVRGFGAVYATAPNYADVLLQIINSRKVQTAMRETRVPREATA